MFFTSGKYFALSKVLKAMMPPRISATVNWTPA